MNRYVDFLKAECEIFSDPIQLALSVFEEGQNDEGLNEWAQKMISGEINSLPDEECISAEEPAARIRRYKALIGEMTFNLEVLLQQSGQLGRVIDIGGGPGILDVFLLKEGLADSMINVDPSPCALELTAELATKNDVFVETKHGFLQDIPLEDESADTCIAMSVLEWSKEWRQGLKEMTRVLRPRGLLYIATSNQRFRTEISPSEVNQILADLEITPQILIQPTNMFDKIFIIGRK